MPTCHLDRHIGYRALRGRHQPDCTEPAHCAGCEPCDTLHCRLCGVCHTTDTNPVTCPSCVGGIREDLHAIPDLANALPVEAVEGSKGGRLLAAARIPGGDAQILNGPYNSILTTSYWTMTRNGPIIAAHAFDILDSDPEPPLSVLATWEDVWRQWLGIPTRRRATIDTAVAFLDSHLTFMAQTMGARNGEFPPEFTEFGTDVADTRTRLEVVLHDERTDDLGVGCFDCGRRLVRRHRDPQPGHSDQGGLLDPTPGVGWECPQCRHRYTPGEYVNAIRRKLVDTGEADGWSDIVTAAQAATIVCGRYVPPTTVKEWARHDKVASRRQGWLVMVYWPDVADQAILSKTRRRATSLTRTPEMA